MVLECRILEKKRIWRHESSDVRVMLHFLDCVAVYNIYIVCFLYFSVMYYPI